LLNLVSIAAFNDGEKMTVADVCTTQKAARMLGLSVTSVQQLVEAGVIEAWKTKGGHRRIPLAAVRAYKGALQIDAIMVTDAGAASILVVEDSKMQRDIYEKKIASWGLGATLAFCDNGYQALIEIASRKPDILLADIMMAGIDGVEVIKTMRGYSGLAEMHVAILSSLLPEDLMARGGVPTGVVFFSKPVNYDELRGYLRACCAHKARSCGVAS
jgi:excisionase family DNA binding protein